ncbi:hypothetical protein ACIQKE_07765 [Streptomyces griseoviridis]|uniref:Uncharacterized protein n=1 Tax=Streptomyces hintoniae TaxID=3075521 RepID=A0ABU2UDG9_9ACTN|nr:MULTISPECIES: hypothetical protein [Streptomyces]MDH6697974.1 hypothetical protein [Streptomyces sp. MAA16]MDT0471306.1 hypothetical protein [Streptomyces sp. DSM 41014]
MSDSSTTKTPSDDVQQDVGHGRHRGEVSAQEVRATPNGRHRKPEPAGAAAA